MRITAAAGVLGIVLAGASPASAVDLVTPRVRSTSLGQQILCTITNVGATPVSASITTIDTSSAGGVPGGPPTNVSIPPGGTAGVGTAVTGADDRYCKFSGSLNTKRVRAQIELLDGAGVKLSLPATR